MAERKHVLYALAKLGDEMRAFGSDERGGSTYPEYLSVVNQAQIENSWFIPEFIRLAFINYAKSLQAMKLERWLTPYESSWAERSIPRTIGVVMAGNVPLVGFHDFISVLISGNKILAKLSSDDSKLLPFLAKRLTFHYPEIASFIEFTEGRLQGFDAIIATGSNNTARYFEYYFGKYPHIIRKNRNGVAVLTGHEGPEELELLADDVFLYFGMGCRNVSKLFVPEDYDFNLLLKAFEKYNFVVNNNKYGNNFDYYRSIFLINKIDHLDNGCVMLTEDSALASPPSVLYYEKYSDGDQLNLRLKSLSDKIQCLVSVSDMVPGAIPPGNAQQPELWDYADGVDTLEFLNGL